jgi:hypothetical protein
MQGLEKRRKIMYTYVGKGSMGMCMYGYEDITSGMTGMDMGICMTCMIGRGVTGMSGMTGMCMAICYLVWLFGYSLFCF